MDAARWHPDTQIQVAAGVIDLGVGHPDPALLPLDLAREAARTRLDRRDASLLAYGPKQGSLFLREQLAAFLSRHYGASVDPEQLLITAGATGALDVLCAQLTRPGDQVLVEEPSYFCALNVFADRGLECIPVEVDDEGVRIDALRAALTRSKPKFLYTIPVYQNPTGATLSPARRTELAELAREHDFTVVADEVYQLLSFPDRPAPPPPMVTISDRAVSVGAFTKILSPGVRLGWIHAPAELCAQIAGRAFYSSGGGANPFSSQIVASAIEAGLQQRYLQQLRTVYDERAAVLRDALQRALPESAALTTPAGGYFIWVRFDDGLDCRELQQIALEHGVGFRPGTIFSARGALQSCLRVGFSYYDEQALREGARRLGQAVEQARRAG